MFEEPYIGMPIKLGNMDFNNMHSNNEDFDDMTLGSLPLAMSYVPFQRWNTTYPLEKALQRGTIFPDLDLPFKGGMRK